MKESTLKISSFPAIGSSQWLWEVCIGIGAIFIIYALFSLFIKKLSKKFPMKSANEKLGLVEILSGPSKILCCVLGAYYVFWILAEHLGMSQLATASKPFINAFIVICLSWISLRWKKSVMSSLQHHPKMISSGLTHTISKVLSIFIFTITILILLQVFKLDIWPLLAFGGIGAAAVGFAAKDVISNFCGGLMLSMTRPFTLGDQIILPSLSIEGPVEEIGWYLTVVRDKDKRPVYLPNAIFSNALVINSSRMTHRRILDQLHIGLADFSKVSSLIESIRSYLKENSKVDSLIDSHIYFYGIKDSTASIYMDIYVKPTTMSGYLAAKEEIYYAIYKMTCEHGIDMTFPSMSIEVIKKELGGGSKS